MFRSSFSVNTFHCKTPRKMHISKMDPSCCIGFYFQTRVRMTHAPTQYGDYTVDINMQLVVFPQAAFESWCEEVSYGECGGDSLGNNSMFSVAEGRVADADAAAEASLLMATSMTSDEAVADGSMPYAIEEISQDFVFL